MQPGQSSVYQGPHARQSEVLASRSVQSHYGVLAATAGKVLVTSTCWNSTGGEDKDYTDKSLVLVKGQDKFRILRSWMGS